MGIEKFIICAANTNAPITPANGMLRASRQSAVFLAQNARTASIAADIASPTFAETRASAMCIAKIANINLSFFVY